MLQEDKIIFNAADENLDGKLDITEFLSFSHPEEVPKMLPIILKQTLDEKDKDSDGFISLQEFIGDKGWLKQRTRFSFKDRDPSRLDNLNDIGHWFVVNLFCFEYLINHLFNLSFFLVQFSKCE